MRWYNRPKRTHKFTKLEWRKLRSITYWVVRNSLMFAFRDRDVFEPIVKQYVSVTKHYEIVEEEKCGVRYSDEPMKVIEGPPTFNAEGL